MSNLSTYREQGYLVLEDGLAKPRDFRSVEIAMKNNQLSANLWQSSCVMKLLASYDIMSSAGLILTTDSDANHKIEMQLIDPSSIDEPNRFYHSGIAPFLGVEDNPNHTMLVIVLGAKGKVQPLSILPKKLSKIFKTEPFEPNPEFLFEPSVSNHTSFFISPKIFWRTIKPSSQDQHSLLFARYSATALY
jgi:hypothetical protein